MQYILITGGAGYIGSHTNALLNALGVRTIVLDSLIYGHKEALELKNGSLSSHSTDLQDLGALTYLEVTPTPSPCKNSDAGAKRLNPSGQSNTAMTNFIASGSKLTESTPSQEASQRQDSQANTESKEIQNLDSQKSTKRSFFRKSTKETSHNPQISLEGFLGTIGGGGES